jgi:hypothetical protein
MAATRIICFRHPHYDGKESPVLTCKTCCGIFVTSMKEKMAQKDHERSHQISTRLDSSFDSSDHSGEERTIYGFHPSSI